MADATGRTVALFAAHPHDEFALAVTLVRHAAAGDDVWIGWFAHDDRPEIEHLRREEAEAGAALMGIPDDRLVFADLEPIALAMQLPAAVDAVKGLVGRLEPELVYCPAFEGGHPDHDALNFATYEGAALAGAECREYPLYHRDEARRILKRVPHFADMLPGAGEATTLELTSAEIAFKHELWRIYRSQHPRIDLLLRLSGDEERFFSIEQTRPLPLRDYRHPPHEPPLLYEEQPDGRFPFSEFADAVLHYRRGLLGTEDDAS